MKSQKIDSLVYQAVFGSNLEKQQARFQIWNLAQKAKIYPASINDFYLARGQNKLPHNFTVPAINLRGMVYESAQAVFKTAKKLNVGALICELARSEMGYTNQPPQEYACVVMAAALREDWSGPLFIQADHFQAKADDNSKPKKGEIDTIKKLIIESINAGFYNIDIDMSTLVDLDKPTEAEQQTNNIKYSINIVQFIRKIEPKGITVSLGGEIGHIGGKNSTLKDFTAYMDGFNKGLSKNLVGMSKISPQTGTHHGGVVLADGSLADINVDFHLLSEMSKLGRKKYGLGGTVQHGASTLPDKFFGEFVKSQALEVHLATGFQNIQMDHPAFPKNLLKKMYRWIDEAKQDEKKPNQTTEQFHYKLRKKAWGQFKKETWDIPEAKKLKIRSALEDRFTFMFKALNVANTTKMVAEFTKPLVINKTKQDFSTKFESVKQVKGLAD